ncbi:DUF4185 domain-containing protein [Jiangella asiatica]|nr:DUF4185 domain-containing protein [Jiangella asiatica]
MPRPALLVTTTLTGTALLVASLAGLPADAAGDGAPSAPEPAAAPPVPAVESAETLANGPRYETATDGTVYSPLDEPAFIAGHDNGQSAGYDNGRGLRFSYWSFGDTGLTEPNGDGVNFLGNTGARTYDLDMSDSISDWQYDGGPDGPREFVQLNDDEEAWSHEHADTDPDTAGCQPAAGVDWMQCGDHLAIWGGSIVADNARDRILAFYAVITRYHYRLAERPNPDDPNNPLPCTDEDIANRVEACRGLSFDGVGLGVAVWTEDPADGDGWARQVVAHPDDPANPTALWDWDTDPSTPDRAFDKGMMIHGHHLYAYGCWGFLASECRVARVLMGKPDAVWDRSAWEFYAGESRDPRQCPRPWSKDIACAVPAPAEGTPNALTAGAAGSSVFWNPYFELFMTIYSVPLSNDLHYRVAQRPEGPWSRAHFLGRALPAAGTGLGSISYAGFAHPEYAEQDGRVQYVTYAHSTAIFSSDFPVLKVTFADRAGS